MNKKLFLPSVIFCLILTSAATHAHAQAPSATTAPAAAAVAVKSSTEMAGLAWDALHRGDYTALESIFTDALKAYEAQAMALHASLTDFPVREKIDAYKVMNDVAVIHFVRLEGLRCQGKTEEAVALAKEIVKEYPYSQAWDASRGGYWSIAEKARIITDQLTGVTEAQEAAAREAPLMLPVLAKPGKEAVIDYAKYGKFTGAGTKEYAYHMGNPAFLAAATGEGIYPNSADVLQDPKYREVYKQGRLNGSHWDHVNSRDMEASFYKWATAQESPGIKLFYTGQIFERAKMYLEAIKAYHALIVHFPRTFGMTYWQTPWYPAQAAVAKIKNIIRFHPELKLKYKGGKVRVINGADKDPANDVFIVDPGVITAADKPENPFKEDIAKCGAVKRTIGGKKVKFVQYANGHWRMLVNGKPFIIRGVTYAPTKVGQSPDNGSLENWMYQKGDAAHLAWVDKNHNNIQDPDEKPVGDFQLMKEMGVNTVRVYDNTKINKELLRELYKKYGIMAIIEDFLGKYAIGSGAPWNPGTDYENPQHLANMMKAVEDTVKELKDEPFVLLWLLGNENNYGVASNADKKPDAYFKFVNQVARRIKELDPDHPVAICNGDSLFVDKMSQYAPDVDVYGGNVYRGDYGFGSFWDEVREGADRPALITEFGAPGYSKFSNDTDAQAAQADYHRGSWMDIMANSAGHAEGEGNAIGGVAFEWTDEWWKNYEPSRHDTKADVFGPFAGGYYFEEWFGLTGQGDGSQSPFLRQLRKAYFAYQQMWTGKVAK